MVVHAIGKTSEGRPRLMAIVTSPVNHAAGANPDGHELVADWCMRNHTPTLPGLPRLYHQYIGHNNNRDFFASTQRETENINRTLYHQWMPQLLYNHHQSGPAGTMLR